MKHPRLTREDGLILVGYKAWDMNPLETLSNEYDLGIGGMILSEKNLE